MGNYDFRRLQRVSDQFNLLLAVSGQQASKNLTSAEKFSLGGPNGVRAYPTGEGSGDTGTMLTAEMRYIVPEFKLMGGDLTVSGFYDVGVIHADEKPLPASLTNRRSIGGYGVGLSLGKSGDFILRSSLAWRSNRGNLPVSDPAYSSSPRLWLQGIMWF